MAAFLLGMGPPPPPQPQDVAVAIANHMLDHPDANIDPQLRMHETGVSYICFQGLIPLMALTEHVVIRIPVNDKSTKDIDIPVDIPHEDFISRVCAVMNLDVTTAELGWKSNDDAKRDPARQLATKNDLRDAFRMLVKTKNNTRRKKEVVMQIVHLVWCDDPSYSFQLVYLNLEPSCSPACQEEDGWKQSHGFCIW